MTSLLQIRDPGQRTKARRLTFDPPIACPAGTPIFETQHGSGCRCGIEQNTLTVLRDPDSLRMFCFDNYAMCTSWQAEKAWIEEGLHGEVSEDRRGMVDGKRYREDLVHQNSEIEVTRYEAPE